MRFFLVVTALASSLAALILMVGFGAAKSAPQEASAAAFAIAVAVIPYVFLRACQLWENRDVQRSQHTELLSALRELQAAQPRAFTATPAPAFAHVHAGAAPSPAPSESRVLKPALMGTCSKCGARNIVEAVRCSSCGTNFDEAGGASLQPTG